MTERFNTFGYHNALEASEPTPDEAPKESPDSTPLERNPVLDRIANGETLTNFTGERLVTFMQNSAEKVSAFGTKTAELFRNTVEKGGAIFAPLTSGRETAFTFDTPFGLKAESPETTPLTKEVVASNVEESRTETAEARVAVEGLTHNFTLEQVAGSREKISGAIEKSAKAGIENRSLLKLIVEIIKTRLRNYLLGKLEENTKQADPIKAEKARKLHEKTQKGMRIIETLGMSETENTEVEVSTPENLIAVEAPEPVQEAPEEVPAAANDNVREIPKLQDEEIVKAFMMGSVANENVRPVADNDELKEAL